MKKLTTKNAKNLKGGGANGNANNAGRGGPASGEFNSGGSLGGASSMPDTFNQAAFDACNNKGDCAALISGGSGGNGGGSDHPDTSTSTRTLEQGKSAVKKETRAT